MFQDVHVDIRLSEEWCEQSQMRISLGFDILYKLVEHVLENYCDF